MFQATDLSLSYGDQIIFENVSLSIQTKERCGLIGRNGSGKSSLFRILSGEEKPDQGSLVIPRQYKIGVLEQHLRFAQETVLQEGILGLCKEEQENTHKVKYLFIGLGLSEDMWNLSPDKLSGGYRLRLQLAKVLLSEPDCLLLDEPTNYLDILSVRFLSGFLRKWKGEMILISHDLQFLDETTTHMMGIHRSKIYKIKGKSKDLFHLIAEEEQLYQNKLEQIEKKRVHMQSFVDRFGAKATKAKQASSRKKALEKLPDLEKLKSLYNLDFSFREQPFMGKKMLEASHVRFSYNEKKPIVEDFSLTIQKDDFVAILGKNGYGKSTLLKLLAGELKPKQGSITLSQALKIGYFGQTSIERLDPSLTVSEEIASANLNLTTSEVRAICGLMMFGGDLANKPIKILSGGEKSRVLLGKIIAKPCNLLFLDEPTHHLDIESIEALIDALEEFTGAVVVVTHSEWMLRRLSFEKLVIVHKDKQEVFLGTYDEFLEKGGWIEEKEIEKEITVRPISRKSQATLYEEQIIRLEKSLLKHRIELKKMMEEGKFSETSVLLARIEQEEKSVDEIFCRLESIYLA